MRTRIAETNPQAHHHVVQFYDNEQFLSQKVARFLESARQSGEPAVVIATPEHRAAFLMQLRANSSDLGWLTMLDAQETLDAFMSGPLPDWTRFLATVGGVLERVAAARGGRIHAYGEMVDLLWRAGNPQAAIRLEEFWNDLAKLHRFELLCAYRMGNFYKEADAAGFDQVCRTHTHVVPTEEFESREDDDAERLREICVLQQRARSLANEVEQRKELEEQLRIAVGEVLASETALRRSEHHLRQVLENAAEGLHWVAEDGTILWANQAELDMLGYRADEYIGHHIAEFHYDPPAVADILQRLTCDEKLQNYEARLRCKDGKIRHVLINSSVYREDGRFVHTGCFTRDITQRRQAEERERAARLEAESATKAKDEFLAMLGHELRNPLSPIVTALQLMRLRGGALGREHLVIERQVKHLVRLVDDLLDVSRITQGRIELNREQVEIADVVAKAVEMSSPLLEERRHHVVIDVPHGRGLTVNGDPGRLTQIFCNLLSNAAKYTDRGGRIVVSAERAGDRVRVRVADNGAGIDAALLPRIFELFIQAKQTLDRSQGGLGLGLTIVKRLVDLHGGNVSAASEGPGHGSAFTVELPIFEGTAPAVGSVRGAQRAWRQLRILVVDDNEDACMLLSESLRELGYDLREARDGPAALTVAAEFAPDVAILDIGLPVMDGYELGRRLAVLRPGIRLVAVTGYGQESDHRRSAEAGFAMHLVKPLALDDVAGVLERLERNTARA